MFSNWTIEQRAVFKRGLADAIDGRGLSYSGPLTVYYLEGARVGVILLENTDALSDYLDTLERART